MKIGKKGGRPNKKTTGYENKKTIGFEIKKANNNNNVNNNVNNNKNKLDIAIENFIEMRKKIKKPLTQNALDLVLKKLNTFTDIEEEKIQILNNSTMNCWQGVFPLKENTKKTTAIEEFLKEAQNDRK